MNKYLPSKKFIIILSSIVIALVIIFVTPKIINYIKEKTAPAKLTNTEVKEKIQEYMTVDSDNDGLKDWEEALYKTDPKKADTDGDGTSDGEEVRLNRDPLKANTAPKGQEPNDKIDPQIIADNKKTQEDFAKLSDTDKIGRMMFSQYLATKKVGQTLTDTDINSIIQNTLTETPAISFKQYSPFEIITSKVNSPEAIKKYGNDVAQVLMTDLFAKKVAVQDYDFYGMAQIKGLILLIQAGGSEKEISQAFNQLSPVVSQYNTLVADLLKVTAPSNLAVKHLALVNAFELIHDNLSQIQGSSNNIIILPPLFSNYSDSINNIWAPITDLANYFTSNKVTFSSSDFGNQLFNGIMP